MKPVQFEQATGTLGYTVGGRKVPVVREHLRGETTSCWRMNVLERLFVLFTGRVWLRVMTTSPAPAAMQVRSPFRAASGAHGKRDPLSAKQLLRWVRRLGKAAVVVLALAAPASAAASEVHLCPPNLCNGSVVLNPPLAAARGVLDFLVSPTGERVFYRADISSDSKYELWTVPITGGASVKLNAPLAFDYDVEGYAATSDGLTVVYRSGRTDSNDWKLYRVRATGGHVAQLSDTVTGSKPVDRDFEIAPDDLSVVYLLTTTARNLYSTPVASPHSTRINQPLVAGGNVMPGISVDRGGHVRFRADARVNNRFEWWLGHIGGGTVMAEIFSDGFEGGGTGAWR